MPAARSRRAADLSRGVGGRDAAAGVQEAVLLFRSAPPTTTPLTMRPGLRVCGRVERCGLRWNRGLPSPEARATRRRAGRLIAGTVTLRGRGCYQQALGRARHGTGYVQARVDSRAAGSGPGSRPTLGLGRTRVVKHAGRLSAEHAPCQGLTEPALALEP